MRDDNALADSYRAWRRSALGRITDELEWRLLLDLAGSVDGKRVLDAGCGDAAFAVALTSRGARVVGVDYSLNMIEFARAAAESIDHRFTPICADARSLPFSEGAFDLVFASALLCLAHERRKTLMEFRRVLASGGKLIVGDLGRWSVWNLHRRIKGSFGHPTWRRAHFFTAKELWAELAAVGLNPGKVRGGIYFFPPIAFLARLMAPFDGWVGQRFTIGASFIAVAATKEP